MTRLKRLTGEEWLEFRLQTKLIKKLVPTIQTGPYAQAKGLLLSVSGGVDSMVMLDCFRRTAHLHRSPLRVVHVHHGTGPFADHGMSLVRDYCQQWEIPLVLLSFEWDGRGNFEWTAAEFRRSQLQLLRAEGEWILLGHHQDDQLETFLQAHLRGADLTTRLGMVANQGHRLRPLLALTRAEILEYAVACGVPHHLDPTNYDTSRLRNALRHEVVPALQTFHNGLSSRVAAWLTRYSDLQHALSEEAAELVDQHDDRAILPLSLFKGSKPYLWPFLLKTGLRRGLLPRLNHIQTEQILGWLAKDQDGDLAVGAGSVFCNCDGVAWWPSVPTKEQAFHLGEPVTWGPWKFKFNLSNATFSADSGIPSCNGGLLQPARIKSHSVREAMRRGRWPLRFRRYLPELQIGKARFHLIELSPDHFIKLEGPDWPSCPSTDSPIEHDWRQQGVVKPSQLS